MSAGKINLDLSQFKHVKSDKHSTTLQHAQGHQLTLAHASLSPESQAQLKALSGIAKDAEDVQDKKGYADGGQVAKYCMYCGGMAHGGECLAEGGEAKPITKVEKPVGNTLNYNDLRKEKRQINNKENNTPIIPGKKRLAQGGLPDSAPDSGNQVPVPSSPDDTAKNNTKKKLHDVGQAASGGENKPELLHPSTWWAEGGEVPKMYADPQDSVSASDAAPDMSDIGGVQQITGQPPQPQQETPAQASVDPDRLAAQQKYNELVNSQDNGLPNTGAIGKIRNALTFNPQGTDAFNFSNPMFNKSQNSDISFGPDGKPPENFNPDVYRKAMESVANEKAFNEEDAKAKAVQIAEDNKVRVAAGLAPLPVPGMSQQDVQQGEATLRAPDAIPQAQEQKDSMGDAIMKSTGMLGDAFKHGNQAIDAQQKAQEQLGQNNVSQLDQAIYHEQQAAAEYKGQYAKIDDELTKHMQDVKDGLVDPNKYWKDHSKIATGIGIILAGFNPTSNPNAALGFLQNQMERNVQAQAKNLDAKQNLVTANLQQFHNLRDATDMARLQQTQIVANQLQQAAEKARSPMAKAAALDAKSKLEFQVAPMMRQIALNQAVMNLANNGGSPQAIERLIGQANLSDPELAKRLQDHYVPNVGYSPSAVVPNEARQQMKSTKDVNDLFNRSLAFSQKPMPTDPVALKQYYAQAQTIQQQLIGSIKQAQHDGVYKESEAEFLLGQIGGSPASMFANLSSVPKIKELQAIKQQEYNNLLSTYGIKPQQLPQTRQMGSNSSMDAAQAWLANPKNRSNPNYQSVLQQVQKGK